MMVMHYPEHINLQKADNGNTPLHVAAACNRLDVVDFLASQVLYMYMYNYNTCMYTYF